MNDENVRAAFPGSLWECEPVADRRRRSLAYMRKMWGDQVGVVALGIGLDAYVNPKGRYGHRRFFQRFFDWPAQSLATLGEVERYVPQGADVYVSPMLRTERERRKESGAGGRWAWADLDGPMTPNRLALLRGFGDDVIVVSSGTGHHVYIELDDWYPPERVEDVNRTLATMLGADSKWSNESLLRLPGTFNHKPRAFDNLAPAMVQGVRLWD